MPFKAANSPYYKIEIVLPGYGTTPRLSSKTERKAVAKRMENCLRYVWEDGRYALIEALEPEGPGQGGKIDLPTLYHAWRRGRLDELSRRIDDPLLEDAVRTYAKTLDYDNHQRGARHLIRITTTPGEALLAGPGARTSWLYDPSNINRCIRHLIQTDGYQPNTVRNETYGFISKLLRHRLGEADARGLLAEVDRPSVDDRRDVVLTAADLRRVISACEWEVRMFLLIKASTGVDKTPILRIRKRDVDFERWTLYVRDTKTERRKATIDLPPVAVLALQVLLEGKAARETAITLTKGQIDYRWRKARSQAKLTKAHGFESGVRLKDLRHTFAAYYLRAGGNIAGLMSRLRHEREAQSLMYGRYETKGTRDMQQAAEAMGLRLPDRLRAQLDEPDQNPAPGAGAIPGWWFDASEPPRIPGEDGPRIIPITGQSGRKGLSPADYRSAVQQHETMAAAARALGVDESTVREQCKRHDITKTG